MQQAAVWLAKAEKDSAKKLGDPIGAASADAEVAKAWIALAAELTNHSRSGPADSASFR
jgi:lysylphosphatidylglycerol synthetase-like protein (DUF2156 family)